MGKKSASNLRKRAKELLSVVLSFCLLFATISIPVNVKAAGGGNNTFVASNLTTGTLIFPGDYIQCTDGVYWDVNVAVSGSSNPDVIMNGWGGTTTPISVGGQNYFSGFTFQMPLVPNNTADKQSYIYRAINISDEMYVYNGEILPANDTRISDPATKKIRTLYLSAYSGVRVQFFDRNQNRIMEENDFYVYEQSYGNYITCSNTALTNPDGDELGSLLGWSNKPDYIDKNSSGYFVALDNVFQFNHWNFGGAVNAGVDGVLKLYPVYECIESDLSVTISNINQGQTPNPIVQSNNRSSSDISISYEKYSGSVPSPISGTPTEPGEYRVKVSVPQVGEGKTDAQMTSERYVESRAYSAKTVYRDFSIFSTAPAEITSAPAAKTGLVYNGGNQNLITAGAAEGGILCYSLNQDSINSSTIPTGKNAGNYTVWYKAIGLAPRQSSDTFSIPVSIAQKTVGLEWSGHEFIYDGEEHCPTVTVTGVCTGDTCTATVTGAATEIGTHTATVSGLSNSNYTLASDATTTVTYTIVDRADKTAKVKVAPQPKTLTYNGDIQFLVTPGEAEGGHLLYCTTQDGDYTDDIPTGINAGTYTVWYRAFAVADLGMLFDSEPMSVTVEIAPKEVGLEWSETQFTYDKNEHCPEASLTGIISGDSCDVTVTGSQTGAGTYTVKATELSNSNYALPSNNTVIMTILPKEAGIEWSDTKFEYDQKEHCPQATITGILDGDTCEVSVTGAQTGAGTYTVKASDLSNSNYKLTGNQTVTMTILAKEVGLEWSDTSFKYDGEEHCPKATATGVLDGDSCEVIVSGGKTEVGTYTATATALSNANYKISGEVTKEFTIYKKDAVITSEPKGQALTYNGSSQNLITAGAAKDGEIVYSLSEDGEYTSEIPKAKNVGEYTIWYMVKGDKGVNDISPKSVKATIAAKTVGIEWGTSKFTYDKEEHCPTATLTGICEGDNCTVTIIGAQTGAGTYTVKATELSNSNYKLPSENTIVMTILTKTVGIEWSDTEIMYDGEEHAPKATATNLCEGDECLVTVTGGQTKIGTYTATATALSNANYKLPANVTIEFTILDPEKLIGSVSVKMAGFIYGGRATSPVITSTTNDVKKASIKYKEAGSPDSAYSTTVPSEVGNYTVKVTLPENEEYNACSATAGFSITYLPVPENAYVINGTTGNNGWYTSDVTITPTAGYELSYGDRNHFSSNPVRISNTVDVCNIYIKNAVTGEQTAMISIGNFNIDSEAPTVEGMTYNGLYFADANGNVKVVVSDANISKVEVEGVEVPLTNEGSGKKSFTITAGRKKAATNFSIYDLAGNKTDFVIYTAPKWAESGEVTEGELYLELGSGYTLPSGSFWSVEGEKTKYNGGIKFYVTREGNFKFTKN